MNLFWVCEVSSSLSAISLNYYLLTQLLTHLLTYCTLQLSQRCFLLLHASVAVTSKPLGHALYSFSLFIYYFWIRTNMYSNITCNSWCICMCHFIQLHSILYIIALKLKYRLVVVHMISLHSVSGSIQYSGKSLR